MVVQRRSEYARMVPWLRAWGKKILSRTSPDSEHFRYLSHVPQLATWKRYHREEYPTFDSRYELYDYVSRTFLAEIANYYLEFGVFNGDSIRYWSEIQTHTDWRFVGFELSRACLRNGEISGESHHRRI